MSPLIATKTLPSFLSAFDVSVDEGFQVFLAIATAQELWLHFLLHLGQDPLLSLVEKICEGGRVNLGGNKILPQLRPNLPLLKITGN